MGNCEFCTEPVESNPQPISVMIGDNEFRSGVVHPECQRLQTIGHEFGVCSCTGFDMSSHDAALELLRRLYGDYGGS